MAVEQMGFSSYSTNRRSAVRVGIMCALLSSAICVDGMASDRANVRVDEDAADMTAVIEVCARCHPATAFSGKARSWPEWNAVFEQMTERGASGTDEQLVRVTRYFLQNLTAININTSPADEIAPVLGISAAAANGIVARRLSHRFIGLNELKAIPGIDPRRLEHLSDRILF